MIGPGNFGSYLALTLTKFGHTVIAVYKNPDRVQAVGRELAKAVEADVAKKDVLKAIGLDTADLALVSLGNGIDLSTLATLYIKELGVEEIWVKVVSEDHAEVMRLIGANRTIFPEKEMAERLARSLHHPNIVERVSIAEDFGILEYTLPDSFAGKSLIDLDLRRNYKVNVVAMHAAGASEASLNPDPTQPLAKGDILFILGLLEDLENLKESLKDK